MATDTEVAKQFIKAAIDILRTMAQIAPRAGTPFIKSTDVATGDISAIIGVTGDKKGSIAVSFTKPCAAAVTKRMLGEHIEDITLDMQDTVGEIANMISGQARAGLTSLGIHLQGSTPTVILGDNHIVRHISVAPIIAIPFSTDEGSFTVEFCFE